MNFLKRSWPILVLILAVSIFFKPFLLQGKLPIPSDTIVGLYHPFRDLYAQDYPNGIPFKNFIITDPIRQQYSWRQISVDLLKRGELPLWNPYTFAGSPLLGNHQSAPFYPLNVLFFVLSFPIAWSILILLQPLLASVFMYLYLRNLRIDKVPSLLAGLVYAFSGFFVVWLEWGTILHSALWLPLILLSVDKIFTYFDSSSNSKFKMQNAKTQFKNQNYLLWSGIFIFSLTSSFFAGHLQTFFYVFLFSIAYFTSRWIQYGRPKKVIFLLTINYLLFTIATAVQWIPMIQFIGLSGRELDQADWTRPGWFIPWQHLLQFLAPDFFGNPTTLNYWGEWNYAEFVGYIGVIPLIFTIFALIFRHDKKTIFFGTAFFLSLLLSFPTILAKLPFILNIPFLSTAQPTRLLFIIDFSLAILTALGFDRFLRNREGIAYSIGILVSAFLILWTFVFFGNTIAEVSSENLAVANRNLIFPTTLFLISIILVYALNVFSKIHKITLMIYIIMVVVTVFDLLRFGLKFTPFTDKSYLFPQTKTIEFLQNQVKKGGLFRIATTDNRIFPPNFSIVYKLQIVDGYDPLYLQRYAELIAASERGEPNIDPPFGFNRIIIPHNYNSKIIDLLGVRYVLSLSDLSSPKLTKVFQEGQTRVYENNKVLPRAFFVEEVKVVDGKEEEIKAIFREDFGPKRMAIIDDSLGGESVPPRRWNTGNVEIVRYSENNIIINTENENEGFLVLVDSFYPTWKARIDGIKAKIYRTDYNFRGVIVPQGRHTVEFYISLL